MKRNSIIFLMITVLAFSLTFFVHGTESNTITIENAEQFMEFSKKCNIDSYSKGLKVELKCDIDLSEFSFQGIPIFCGELDGNGFTISGITLTETGSYVGLFRHLSDTAYVHDLHVDGLITPNGSAAYIGGIAGSNAGRIENCHVTGTVQGAEFVGCIAGINTQTGNITNCSSSGNVTGMHFIGGITGSNEGILSGCINHASVNNQPMDDAMDLSQITLESLTGTESVTAVTDVGGIAGISSGSIQNCQNEGVIGYPHVGYNVGGIAGRQSGYLAECTNRGEISGRKEVGGIVGQLEPAVTITYSTDTLQILNQQVNNLSGLIKRAGSGFETSSQNIQTQITILQGEIEKALTVFENMLPEDDLFAQPDIEDVIRATASLKEILESLRNILNSIQQIIATGQDSLAKDLQAISDTANAITYTVNHAADRLGGSISDLSDEESDSLTAVIDGCRNSGKINADRNGGGIVGAINFENDLDPEDDVLISGEFTLHYSGTYRAVVLNCQNDASVFVKKQYGGGIAGFAPLGLIRTCRSAADLLCDDASYIGGIAGRSDGYIRNCAAKCQIRAKSYAGGIAGYGHTVSDCNVISHIEGEETRGSILGHAKDLTCLSNNLSLSADDLGAVDNISYEHAAQSTTPEKMLAYPDIPEFFRTFRVTFVFYDGKTAEVDLPTGETLTESQIPTLPDLDGCAGQWLNLDQITFFDTQIICSYESKTRVLQSMEQRGNGLPIILAEGAFLPDHSILISKAEGMDGAIETWSVTTEHANILRYLIPEGYSGNELAVYCLTADNSWKRMNSVTDGRYFVFSVDGENTIFSIVPLADFPWWIIVLAAAVIMISGSVTAILVIRNRKKNKIK